MATDAIQSALALFREPGRIADFRDRPLPPDVGQVIRVAAGEAAAVQSAQDATEENAETLAEASIFYLQQMLFVANADSYRVLGLTADAPQQLLREHYRWLMRWLHPDRNPDGWEVVYADRVNAAWQDLKTKERRAEYDVRAPGDAAHGLTPVSMAVPIRIRAQAPDAHRPFLSGAMVRRLPAIIFGALSVSALAVLGLMYWAQVDSQREIELAAQRANGSVVPATPADIAMVSATDTAVAAVQESLVVVPEAGPEPEPSVADPLPSSPDQVSESIAAITVADPELVETVADQAPVATAEGPASVDSVVEPAVIESASAPVVPAPVLVAASEPAAAPASAPAGNPISQTPPDEPPVVTREPLPRVTWPPESVATVVPAPMPVGPARASVPPATVPLAIESPEPAASPVASQVETADVPAVAAARAIVAAPKPAPPVVEVPIPARSLPSSKPTVVVAATKAPTVDVAKVNSPADPPPAPPREAPATADSRASIAPADPQLVEAPAEPVADPVAAPPARNEAQKLVGEMASAYASGNLARFDNLFMQSSAAGAGGMRNRMQSTQMRYLEMGEVDWSLTHDSAVGRVSFRDTFVPRGAKKAVTQAGEIHLIVRVDSGRARISSLEVASIAN